jgi:release factor glutamine methyltransferase
MVHGALVQRDAFVGDPDGGAVSPEGLMGPPEGFAPLLERLHTHWRAQPDLPHETPHATLCALWHLAAGHPCSAAAATERPLPHLSAAGHARLDELLAQRLQGVPLAHLTARQRFMGLEMVAGQEALIPRPETELLAQAALGLLGELQGPDGLWPGQPGAPRERRRRLRVVDVCTGSGNLALALAHHAPQARVWGSDVCQQALGLAQRNAHHLGMTHRVRWREGDLLSPFHQPRFQNSVDLLVCNPPYLPSRRVQGQPGTVQAHEPRLAFDGGGLGLNIVLRLLREAPSVLRSGGWLALEVGEGQGPPLVQRLQSQLQQGGAPYAQLRTACDASGSVRVLMAQSKPPARTGDPVPPLSCP